jgi:3,4-dihydroxy 2-butanone 4-phosphate synthase/GTP cyclohydrolase II
VGTIRDLIAYRRKHDHLVEKVTTTQFETVHGGSWTAISYRNKAAGNETLALVKGQIDPNEPTLVRMHAFSMFADALGETNERTGLLNEAMRIIGEEGSGVVVLVNRQSLDMISSGIRARSEGPARLQELRDYGVGAQILADLGVHDMILLTNAHQTLVALDGYGLSIVGERPFGTAIGQSDK